MHRYYNINIETVPLVLLVGVSGSRLYYSDVELQKLFARYNGQGVAADQPGWNGTSGCVKIFEKYNAMIRSSE
jgi:hypothetical protein